MNGRREVATRILSFVVMQLGWFACVLGAAHGHPWAGPLLVAAILAIHVRMQPVSARRREIFVLAVAAAAGFVVDTVLLYARVITIDGARVSPLWLVALWPNLAAATASSGTLGALARRPVLGSLIGALAAPLAYDGGRRLGAVGFDPDHVRAMVLIGVAWCGVIPTLFWLREATVEV